DHDDRESLDLIPPALSLEHWWRTREPVRNVGSDGETSSLHEARRVAGMYTMQTHLTVKKQPSDLTDDVLVQRAHIGDQSAFEMLVDRYSTSLLLLISHLVRDEHLAHDILQHVFIQLYRSLPTLRPE